MTFRMVAATLVLATSVAAAEPAADLALASVCAEIDAARDVLPPTERAVAQLRLARALQDADVLVVDHGCTEHYVLSHEQDGDDFIVRLVGPAGVRRARNPERDALPRAYERLVIALLDAQEEAAEAARLAQEEANEAAEAALAEQAASARPEVATTEPTDTTYADATAMQTDFDVVPPEPASTVKLDALFYVQLHAGSFGAGFGIGVRFAVSPAVAVDLSLAGAGGDDSDLVETSAKVLGYRFPEASSSSYFGGGIGFGSQTSYEMESSGMSLHGTAGYGFNRTQSFRMFVQGDLGIPLYSGAPTLMFSVGAGG